MVPHDVRWPDVFALLIISIPGIIAAVASLRNGRELKTGNDKTVGEMVAEGHAKLSDEETAFTTHRPVKPKTNG